ncbi:MAG: DUF2779 domain-containing protein [Nanoarchaeota archaeon]
MPTLLTKSRYMTGLTCPRCLWLMVNDPESMPTVDEATQRRMDEGTTIGILAQKLYPDGAAVPQEDFGINLCMTKQMLASRRPLFEAAFAHGRCYARADILVPGEEDTWDIVEVKSSTRVKDEHIEDVAFQKYCYQGAGLRIARCYIMHLNSAYIKDGDIDPKSLFTTTDVTEKADKVCDIGKRVDTMLAIIDQSDAPTITIGLGPGQCSTIHSCCEVGEGSVFELHRAGELAFRLYAQGHRMITDIPEDTTLSQAQRVQRDAARTGKTHIDKEKIGAFIKGLRYPLHFLDFETFQTAIPLLDATRPYQQIPFQYSLHVQEELGGIITHHSYLASTADPREEFIRRLQEDVTDLGSIIVYNAAFERGIINALINTDKLQRWAEDVSARIIDLHTPFRTFIAYSPAQHGSTSLKAVLPAFTGAGYDDMEITDGSQAASTYVSMITGATPSEQHPGLREALEAYCALDTEAMILLLDALRDLSA